MAKNWSYNKEESALIRKYTEKRIDEKTKQKVDVEVLDAFEFSLIDLFPDWKELDEVQQACILNGLKQKMDDAIARSKDQKLTEKEKREIHDKLWTRIVIDRKWNLESKETGSRGPTVSLATLVPPLVGLNLSIEQIAQVTGKSVEVIQQFIESGKEEEQSSETEEILEDLEDLEDQDN